MKNITVILLLITGFTVFSVSGYSKELEDFIKQVDYMYPNIHNMDWVHRRAALIYVIEQNRTLKSIAMQHQYNIRDPRSAAASMEFPCRPYTVSGSGKTVHQLAPGDINVIAALGDSLTAGLGINAKTVVGLLTEYRGYSFSIGGIDNQITLANFLRKFNPNLKGFSLKNQLVILKHTDGFNLAESGANSKDILSQVDKLIATMKSDSSIDFEKDWKLVTIFIGNNDICDSCTEDNINAELYQTRLKVALDRLHKELPRTIVNLMTLLDSARVRLLNANIICDGLHMFECKCAAYAKDPAKVQAMNDEFQAKLAELIKSGRYDTKDDFTVVLQPFLEQTRIPTKPDGKPDLSYFAPDCFHFNLKGHQEAALSLWNNMFEKVGQKTREWVVGESFECPSATNNPYIATSKNSLI